MNDVSSRLFSNSLDILKNNINSLNPAISIIAGDFSGRYYSFDPSDNIRKELDIITSIAWYTQILTNLTILQTIHLPALTLLLHLILA